MMENQIAQGTEHELEVAIYREEALAHKKKNVFAQITDDIGIVSGPTAESLSLFRHATPTKCQS